MIAMNTKNWNRNVEIVILIIHPWKPEQEEEKEVKLYLQICGQFPILSSNYHHHKYIMTAAQISGYE